MTTRVVKKDLVKSIPLELTKLSFKTVKHGNVVAAYQMNKPSDLPSVYQPLTTNRPKVHLDLKESHDLPQASIMSLNHRNILRVEAIKEIEKSASGQEMFAIFVESHDGPLLSFLLKLDLAELATRAVPSQSLRNVSRQLVDIVEELWANGLYHGDLSIHNCYYSKDGDGITVKLVNFRKRDIDLHSAQLLDWVGLGSILRSISDAARLTNNDLSCLIIDDLAAELESLTDSALLPILKERTLNHMYFWDTRKRANFYIHKIPEALNDRMFVQRVRAHAWNLPWNNNPHGGLIDAMNEYRRDVLDITEYDGNDPLDNVKCMSGAYTHQEKLEEKIVDDKGDPISVDVAVQTNQPMLCLTLYRLLPEENLAE